MLPKYLWCTQIQLRMYLSFVELIPQEEEAAKWTAKWIFKKHPNTLPPCNDSNTKETGQFNLFYLMQFITRLYLGNRLVTSKGSQGTTNYHRCYLVVQNGRLQDARIARTFRGYPWFDMIILLSFPAKNIYVDGNRVNEWPLVKSNHHRAYKKVEQVYNKWRCPGHHIATALHVWYRVTRLQKILLLLYEMQRAVHWL